MEMQRHDLPNLFKQLGLPAEPLDIERFVAQHRPLPHDVKITEAPFWTPSQAAVLREGLLADADWAGAIDTLNVKLSEHG